MRKLYIFFILCIISLSINAQNNVGIGTNTPDPSAKLDILAADKGLLIPRVNLTGTGDVATITTPATGLLVFNEAAAGSGATAVEANSFYYYNGSKWVKLQSNNPKDWTTLGNADADITAPAAPATYGTSTFGSSENWIGTIGSDDFTVGTSNIERIRIKSDGKTGIGTATPTANYLMTINPTNNTLRGGIDMTLSGMTSAANGINITTGVSAVNGINVTHSSGSLTTSLFGIGGVLSSTNIVSGYLGYRNGSGKSYGVMGINGTTGSYATNANTWAGYFNGRTVITSENSPTSPLGVDLEVQNTTAGSGNPATIQLRQTTANTTSGNTLTNLNFGDATVTTPQAQINVSRDQASGGSADMPTRMTFSTTPDGSSTLTERVRIDNAGAIGLSGANFGTSGQVITSQGTGAAVTWAGPGRLSNIVTYTTGSGTYTVPSGVTGLLVKIVGGGGAGGSANYLGCSGYYHSASGGGAGAYCENFYASPSATYSYSVGSGGAANTSGCGSVPTSGGNGGSTTFGSLSAGGGTGGRNSYDGFILAGGAGGTASGAQININGARGGGATSTSYISSGYGANSIFGGGGSGLGVVNGNSTGYAGTAPGAGGSGAVSWNTGWQAGGAGSNGIIIIYEYK